MGNLIKMLEGRKTYIVAALMAINVFLHGIGKIDDATFNSFSLLLAGGGLAALRSAIK